LIERLKKRDLIIGENDKIDDGKYASKFRDGVEVVDVKVVPKGIPEKNRKTWDQIS
jgi:hypothetical protein